MYFAKTDTSPRTQDSPHKERPKFQQVPSYYSVVPILLFLQKFPQYHPLDCPSEFSYFHGSSLEC